MGRICSVWLVVLGVALMSGAARAQPPRPSGGIGVSRPVYSPYLNLARRDAPPGINYYGIVRPQMAAQNNIQALQQQLAQTQRALTTAPPASASEALPVTGLPVTFLNTGGYFLNAGTGAPTVGPQIGRPLVPARPRR